MIAETVITFLVLHCIVYQVESYPFHRGPAPQRSGPDTAERLIRPLPNTGVQTIVRPLQVRAGISSELPQQIVATGRGENNIPVVRTAVPGVNFNVAFDRSGGSSVVHSRREWQSRLDESGNRRGLENQFVNSVWRPLDRNVDVVWDNGVQFTGLGNRAPRRQVVGQNNGLGAFDIDLSNSWTGQDLTNDIRRDPLLPTSNINGFVRTDLGQGANPDNTISLAFDTSLNENRNVNNRLDLQGRRRNGGRPGFPRRTLTPQGTLAVARDPPLVDNNGFQQTQVQRNGEIRPVFPNRNYATTDFERDRALFLPEGHRNIDSDERSVPRPLAASIPSATPEGTVTGEQPLVSVGQENERTVASKDSSSFQYNFSY